MANPSLQIGNSNWAIKEDNLLGYSTAGTRFVPQPITMTRASAGTRVNSSGLVETVELLGSEDVTNGDFTQLPLGTGWDAYTSGSSTVAFTEGAILSIDGSNSNVGVYQQNIFTNGVQYKIIVSVKATASFDAEIVESQGAATQTTIGTVSLTTSYQDFVFYFTGTGTNDLFIHRLYGETAGQNQQIYIKEVSVKESTKNNLARVDYDGTASSLLVEPERTNNLTASQDLTDSFWNSSTRLETVVASTVLSPDGTTFGFKAIPTTNNSTKYLDYDYGFLSMPSSSEATYSIFVKPFGYTNFQIATSSGFSSRYQNFELTGDGIIGTGDVNGATIDKVGEWYRCSITQTTTGTTPRVLSIPTPSSGLGRNPTFTGNGTDGVLLWGASLEVGSYPTSYIPNLSTTSGSTVTRVQDQYSKTGISNLINSEEGVLFVEMALLIDDGNAKYITLSDGNTDNVISINFDYPSSRIQYRVDSGGVLQSNIKVSYSGTNMDKIAAKWKVGTNEASLWINGVELGTDTIASAPIGLNTLKFSSPTDGGTFNGKVKQLQVFKTADIDLAALTS